MSTCLIYCIQLCIKRPYPRPVHGVFVENGDGPKTENATQFDDYGEPIEQDISALEGIINACTAL